MQLRKTLTPLVKPPDMRTLPRVHQFNNSGLEQVENLGCSAEVRFEPFFAIQSMISNYDTFFLKNCKKCDNLGTFTQKIPFFDYNKPKKAKRVTIWGHGL